MSTRKSAALTLLLLGLSFAAPVYAAPPQAAAQPTLYRRLGGYDALAAVTDDFLGRLATWRDYFGSIGGKMCLCAGREQSRT